MITSSKKILCNLVLLAGVATLSFTTGIAQDYPREPDRPGSGKVRWEESLTPDGWTMVTNEDGATLGYSKNSRLQLIQVDGYAFKDLNRNNLLDQFEDWRVDFETRAASIVEEIPIEQMMGMKMNPFGIGGVNAYALDEDMMNALDMGYRQSRAPGATASGRVKASWNNMVQEYIEGLDNIVCIPAVWIADPRSGDVSEWPSNVAMAATFDPEVGAEYGRLMSEEWRAMGISMQVATQMDLATEPRWRRIPGTFGEDPALSMDMARAVINGWQSTYDEDGNDLGWGEHSVNNQMKHFPGDGAGEAGRESHTRDGAYNVFPGGQFWTHVLPFVACMGLPGKTETVTAAMTNFSVGIEANGRPVGGERVATSYSKYKINNVLRGMYGWDGYILTDFGIITGKNYGVEDLTPAECMLAILEAGCDAYGGEGRNPQESVNLAMEAYELGVAKLGEAGMNEIMKKSTERMLRTHFNIGIVDNPYLSLEIAETVPNNEEHNARGYQAILKSIVMLKNSGSIIHRVSAGAGKPAVYIPMVYSAATAGRGARPASANPAFNLETAGAYFNVITDALAGTLTGPADDEGNPTLSPNDIIRASAAEIARCDFALVRITSPQNGNPTYMGYGGITSEGEKYTYRPISLQYRPYTANSEFVRRESIGGDMIEVIEELFYDADGEVKTLEKENRSYFGETAIVTNESDLDFVLNTASAADRVIVALDVSNPMVFAEFESEVDAIVVGFGGGRSSHLPDKAFLDIISGQVEPSGLLPLQMPANMETVEAQFEDVPRDMECHVDSDGNTYDFAFGLDWSGVIKDDRTAKYDVPPIVGEPPE
ncbi:glycoside hydrolase family 3 C-terminal domain-containing protein [bacterium]|nr:glycoside hydrolase family 3 C-terminal domain-containing protein [bacterium]